MTEIRMQTDISAVNLKTNELTTDIAPLREGGGKYPAGHIQGGRARKQAVYASNTPIVYIF
jgi:hypothetical protein